MKDVDIAVLFTEDKDPSKYLSRSKGDINVDRLARNISMGGGHKNASGGSTGSVWKKRYRFCIQH